MIFGGKACHFKGETESYSLNTAMSYPL